MKDESDTPNELELGHRALPAAAPKRVIKRRKTVHWGAPGIIERLGTVPDNAIGMELGVTRERVRQVREKLGIAAHRDTYRDAFFTPEVIALLGTMNDSALSRQLGNVMPTSTIREKRLELGIPRFIQAHGTSSTTYARGCRCDKCKRYNADRANVRYANDPAGAKAYNRDYVDRVRPEILAKAPHNPGKNFWFSVGCRCDGCKLANAEFNLRAAQRRIAKMS